MRHMTRLDVTCPNQEYRAENNEGLSNGQNIFEAHAWEGSDRINQDRRPAGPMAGGRRGVEGTGVLRAFRLHVVCADLVDENRQSLPRAV